MYHKWYYGTDISCAAYFLCLRFLQYKIELLRFKAGAHSYQAVRTVTSAMYLVIKQISACSLSNLTFFPRNSVGCSSFNYPNGIPAVILSSSIVIRCGCFPDILPYAATHSWSQILAFGLAQAWTCNFFSLDFLSWWPLVLKLPLWAEDTAGKRSTWEKVLMLEATTVTLKQEWEISGKYGKS